jgi:multiple sugar transport system permease protein
MFIGGKRLVSISIAGAVDELPSYIAKFTGVRSSVSVAYSNCILATGTLMVIIPVVVLYLFAQRQFVESISSSGIKM